MAIDFPGPTLGSGHGTARVYLDDGSTPDQRRGLEVIFQGRNGFGVQGLGSAGTKWPRTESTPLSDRGAEGEVPAAVGPFETIRSKRLRNAGRVVRLDNVSLLGASPTELTPSATGWSDPALPRSFRRGPAAQGGSPGGVRRLRVRPTEGA